MFQLSNFQSLLEVAFAVNFALTFQRELVRSYEERLILHVNNLHYMYDDYIPELNQILIRERFLLTSSINKRIRFNRLFAIFVALLSLAALLHSSLYPDCSINIYVLSILLISLLIPYVFVYSLVYVPIKNKHSLVIQLCSTLIKNYHAKSKEDGMGYKVNKPPSAMKRSSLVIHLEAMLKNAKNK